MLDAELPVDPASHPAGACHAHDHPTAFWVKKVTFVGGENTAYMLHCNSWDRPACKAQCAQWEDSDPEAIRKCGSAVDWEYFGCFPADGLVRISSPSCSEERSDFRLSPATLTKVVHPLENIFVCILFENLNSSERSCRNFQLSFRVF